MKRINYDELIWFIILALLSFLMIFLIYTDKIQNFINGRMLIFFKISVIIIVIFTICQIPKIFTIPSRVYITNKFLPIIMFLFVSLIYFGYQYNSKDYVKDNFNDIEIITDNISSLEGENLYFKGFIYRDDDNKSMVYLARERLTCCQFDSSVVKIPLINMDTNAIDEEWVMVYGKVVNDDGLKLQVLEYTPCEEPEDRFLKEDWYLLVIFSLTCYY